MAKRPNVLYHYTTQAGLLGILDSDALWATKIHYLNDASEYQLALDLASAILNQLLKGERSTRQRRKISSLLDNLRMIEHMNVCVCSFSENRDQLSQWRAYAGGSSGYSIGFCTAHLTAKAESQSFRLVKCIYREADQVHLVETLVRSSLAKEFNTTPAITHPSDPRTIVVQPVGGDFAKNFAQLAPLIKSPAFHEEAEWRLVSTKGIDVRQMFFRPGNSMLVPYIPFDLESDKSLYLNSLVVGPTPHAELAHRSATSLLARWGVAHPPKVQSSKAPYRAW